MRLKKLTSALISLFGVSALFCCKDKYALKTAIDGKSLLWEITGKELQEPSYFLGTMHLMCAEDAILSNNTSRIISTVNAIYLELDMDNAGELFNGMMDLGLKNRPTLSEVISEADYQKVKSFFESFNATAQFEMLERQPPLLITSTLYELLLPCKQKNGIEMKIIEAAYKQKKETKGLETFAYQAGLLDSIPTELQAKDLVNTIDSLEDYGKGLAEMIDVYKGQDIDRLYELSVKEGSSTAQYMDLLLYKRNANWVSQFPAIAKNASTLFAVGAGHLGGSKGVINLLRQRGYQVRPIIN